MNIFERVKDEIPPEQAAVMYGLPVRKNKARCCFHEERTPSMVFRGKTFHCFGCGAHGSTIDLCMRLFRLSPRDAALKLAKDFNIPVDTEYHAGNNPRRMRLNITKEELSLLGIREGRPFEIQVNVEDNGDPVYETFFPPTLAQAYNETPSFIEGFIVGRAKERKERCASMLRVFTACSEWDASMRQTITSLKSEIWDIISRFERTGQNA